MSISDGDYQGRFTIPTPKGVYQAAGDTNINTDYAYLAQNIRTERGLLASSYGTSRAFPALGAQIETLARFYRRTRPDDADVYVAAAGGAIYTYTMGTEGWVKRSEGYKSDVWSSVTYETTEGGATVDILILSNAKDGMIAVYGSDLRVEKKTLTLGDAYAEVKFATLGRHAERIWGTGAEGYPDSIFYSRPYDPFNWTGVPETPELGGGMINQPTWDGDKFIALEPFGGYLLAVKERTIFEIRGTDPSSFTITEAYGTDGPVEERSICTDRTSMLYLSQNGIGLYDGNTLRLLSRDALHETMRMRMEGMDGAARACVCNHIYYLAMCIKENESGERYIDLSETGLTDEDFASVSRVYLIGCGSAYHVGMAARYVLEKAARVPCEVDLASEFRYRDPILEESGLVIIISQSGETADSLAALRLCKERGVRTLAVVNVVGSSIAREADSVIYTWAGPEIAVATTKAYSTQLAALYLIAVHMAEVRGQITPARREALIDAMLALPDQIERVLSDKERVQWYANKMAACKDVFFIGRGLDYAISMEGSLKLKEISYIHSEAYAAGELKHGTISLIEDGVLVVAVATQPELFEKEVSNMVEVRSRGASLFGLTTYGQYAIEDTVNFTVYVPRTDPLLTTSLAVVPLQLLAYYISCAKGLDVDKPRNLAKSVTVE